MKKLYSIICIIVDAAALCFFLLAALFGVTEKKDLLIAIPFIALCALFLAISVSVLIKLIKRSKERVIRNSMSMKLAVYFLCASLTFLGVPDGVYAFGMFFILGCIFTAAAIFYIRTQREASEKLYKTDYSYCYESEWEWDAAAKEYMRLHDIKNISDITDDDDVKICAYTAAPLSYFFYWLAASGYLTEVYYEFDPHVSEMLERMLKREITPIEMLSEMEYYFSDDEMLAGIKPFFRSYFDHGGKFTDRDNYLYDYYEANGDPEDRYYCIDFSWEVLDKLTAKIEERKENWERELNVHSDREYYDDEPLEKSVHSSLFNADLDTVKSGIRYSGFPNGDVYRYLDRCAKSLDSLSPLQMKRLERFFADNYGAPEAPELTFLRSFKADTLHIFEPKENGDVVYVVSGTADFEPEHGISFTVRNGQIIAWGYSYDFDDVYSVENTQLYELAPDIDFTEIKSEADAERCAASGRLVKTKLLPDISGCAFKADEEYVYLTPRALLEKEKLEKRIRNIKAFANMDCLEMIYSLKYEENSGHERQSIVPRELYITTAEDNERAKISFHIKIWF